MVGQANKINIKGVNTLYQNNNDLMLGQANKINIEGVNTLYAE